MTVNPDEIQAPPRPVETARLLRLYREMSRIRAFEERAAVLYAAGRIPGFVHLSVGQEAVAVGTCAALRPDDVITSTHRGHGHVLAKGLDVTAAFAELFGRESGSCRGRGGSMHIADPALGIFGANGIVGAGVPIAVGAATAARLRADGRVAVSFFGDGATSTGAFHEGAVLGGEWRLPLILLCENNQYSEFSATGASVSPERRAGAYDMDFVRVDGNDVERVATEMDEIVARVRSGGRPCFVEAVTFRVSGHYEGDQQRYRSAEFDRLWLARDPIDRAREALRNRGVEDGVLERLALEVQREIEAAVTVAAAAPEPAAETLHAYVRAEPRAVVTETPLPAEAEPVRMSRSIRAALRHELHYDPGVFVAGIDVGAGGNVFGLTRGLAEEFPGRVRDTPIAESAIVGMGIGAAMAGLRPVVELMYSDFIGVCLDQIMNQAAKLRYMTGGGVTVPLTIRTQFGAGRSSGAQHSQSLEALLAHIPGISVVMPSTPSDAYGLLRAAIRDDNPVVVIEHRLLYERTGPGFAEDHLVPIGKAAILRPGSDVTVVSVSRMARESLAAAERLSAEGIDAEVIDLRTVVPLDWDTVLGSLARTNRLVVAHEAVIDFGIGAEIAARAVNEGFCHLDAPVFRVGAPVTPAPYAPSLEAAWLPGADDVVAAVRRSMAF
ncbi:alpha-ketoacid dehydrogenase subunit alpha/beta [Streptosporangium sp. CA-115845]|uniref:alpha-ketoacid dehydrogenase subunit alpha/beta n=1 Tax=Streptosporangium sp. CA-115845 TaxID=3240071 RepID=UPI003D8AC69D